MTYYDPKVSKMIRDRIYQILYQQSGMPVSTQFNAGGRIDLDPETRNQFDIQPIMEELMKVKYGGMVPDSTIKKYIIKMEEKMKHDEPDYEEEEEIEGGLVLGGKYYPAWDIKNDLYAALRKMRTDELDKDRWERLQANPDMYGAGFFDVIKTILKYAIPVGQAIGKVADVAEGFSDKQKKEQKEKEAKDEKKKAEEKKKKEAEIKKEKEIEKKRKADLKKHKDEIKKEKELLQKEIEKLKKLRKELKDMKGGKMEDFEEYVSLRPKMESDKKFKEFMKNQRKVDREMKASETLTKKDLKNIFKDIMDAREYKPRKSPLTKKGAKRKPNSWNLFLKSERERETREGIPKRSMKELSELYRASNPAM